MPAPGSKDDSTKRSPHIPAPESGADTRVSKAPGGPLRAAGGPAVAGYELDREIARGGMGVVYAARDLALGREVAVKVMLPGTSADEFERESRITARLPHPGVPPVHAIGTLPDGRRFLAMKLIRGKTLKKLLAERGDPEAERGRLVAAFEQICQAVGYAHAQGIVHRDLKPDNVMVGAFGEVQVMDWGLAKAVGRPDADTAPEPGGAVAGADAATVAGAIKGTPAYMAPEQARGESVDARTDVFALGGILAAILTGKPPFVGNTVMDTVLKAAQADLDACFAELDECGADPELVELAKRCLAPDPDDRCHDGEEVATEVAAYRAGVEDRARRAERDRAVSAAEAREQRKRRKVQLALAGAVVLILTAGGATVWWLDRLAADRRTTEARLEGERDAEARHKAEQARDGVTAGLALAADLRRQYKFKAAEAALAQTAALATGAPELLPAVTRAQHDLALVARLDDIRYRKWTAAPGAAGEFNTKDAPGEYRRAFADHGLDPVALEPAQAAGQIAASAVRSDLVAALDDWALYEPTEGLRNRLLEVARRADPGPWLDRLRDPAVRGDHAAVAKLASADLSTVSTSSVSVLAELLRRTGQNPIPLLSAARARRPTDFELALIHGLAQSSRVGGRDGRPAVMPNPRDPNPVPVEGGRGDEIGPLEAARAIRPENPTVWNNLGVALLERGDFPAAVITFEEAIRLLPASTLIRTNLGRALWGKGDLDRAIAEFGEVVKQAPTWAEAHLILGKALRAKGDRDGAMAEFAAAIKLEPPFRERSVYAPPVGEAHACLGGVLGEKGDAIGAVAAFQRAIKFNPNDAAAQNSLAWLLATGPETVLDGRAAVECATRACEQTRWNDPWYIDTLAAAHARAGNFDKAVEYQKRVLSSVALEKEARAQAQHRLELYEQGKAYRAPSRRIEKGD